MVIGSTMLNKVTALLQTDVTKDPFRVITNYVMY